MADWSAQFVPAMLLGMHSLRYDLGTDVMAMDREAYNTVLMTLAINAMTLKIIQDLHPDLVTDAALQGRLDIAVDTGPNGDRSGWPGWILLQVAPENLAQYGGTLTDSRDVLQQKINDYWAAQ